MFSTHRLLGVLLWLALPAVAEEQGLAQPATEIPTTQTSTMFDPRSAEAGGVRRWRVEVDGDIALRAAPSRDAASIANLTEDALLSNLGCAPSGGALWCAVRDAFGGRRAYLPALALVPARGPDGTVPTGRDDSKDRVTRHDVDAVGEVACAQERGQPLGPCSARVARSGGGDATVAVRFANGFSRLLFFTHGRFRAANPTMSGTGTDTDHHIDGDQHLIRVDDQMFEINAGLLFGP